MCIPAAPLAIAAGAMQAVGTLAGGMQAQAQGRYESQLAKRNAQMEVEAARESIEIGRGERRDLWRRVSQAKGQNIAAMAANGIEVDYGAAARIQDDTQMLAEADAENLYRNIEDRTKGRLISASNFVEAAKASRAQGKSALVGSVFGAATSLMGGFQQAAGIKAKMGR